MQHADVVIAGAGIAGFSIALELVRKGRAVTVVERYHPGAGASRAAAGMLAVYDPGNPVELLPLSERSQALYPDYLRQIEQVGGAPVPFETAWTLESQAGAVSKSCSSESGQMPLQFPLQENSRGWGLHREWSLDPRKLFASLLRAAKHSGVAVECGSSVRSALCSGQSVRVELENSQAIVCDDFVDCTGAWNAGYAHPVKGQMLRVQLPPETLHMEARGNVVVRTPDIYLVPRLDGSCVIGATVEQAGFDTAVHPGDIHSLRERASALLPLIATAPEVESWAGLRPGTTSGLPVLGPVSEHIYVANGLYRNGILLAPVVAESLGALISGTKSAVDLSAFEPDT